MPLKARKPELKKLGMRMQNDITNILPPTHTKQTMLSIPAQEIQIPRSAFMYRPTMLANKIEKKVLETARFCVAGFNL